MKTKQQLEWDKKFAEGDPNFKKWLKNTEREKTVEKMNKQAIRYEVEKEEKTNLEGTWYELFSIDHYTYLIANKDRF